MTTGRPLRQVESLMTSDPITVLASASLREVARLMAANRIHGLPVVDADGIALGLIAQTDLVRMRATHELWANRAGLSVAALMTSPAICVAPDAGVAEAAMLMDGNRVHRLVVVDADGRPIGIVSASDLVDAIVSELA